MCSPGTQRLANKWWPRETRNIPDRVQLSLHTVCADSFVSLLGKLYSQFPRVGPDSDRKKKLKKKVFSRCVGFCFEDSSWLDP